MSEINENIFILLVSSAVHFQVLTWEIDRVKAVAVAQKSAGG